MGSWSVSPRLFAFQLSDVKANHNPTCPPAQDMVEDDRTMESRSAPSFSRESGRGDGKHRSYTRQKMALRAFFASCSCDACHRLPCPSSETWAEESSSFQSLAKNSYVKCLKFELFYVKVIIVDSDRAVKFLTLSLAKRACSVSWPKNHSVRNSSG